MRHAAKVEKKKVSLMYIYTKKRKIGWGIIFYILNVYGSQHLACVSMHEYLQLPWIRLHKTLPPEMNDFLNLFMHLINRYICRL